MNATAPTIAPEVAAILADVDRRGITLQAQGGKLRFRPRSEMTPDLAQRIRANKPALLELLRVGEAKPVCLGTIADTTAPAGVTIGTDDAKSAHGRGGWTRHRAARLIRNVRQADTGLAVLMRDTWAERVAVCTIAGGLTEDHAEQVALAELETMLH